MSIHNSIDHVMMQNFLHAVGYHGAISDLVARQVSILLSWQGRYWLIDEENNILLDGKKKAHAKLDKDRFLKKFSSFNS